MSHSRCPLFASFYPRSGRLNVEGVALPNHSTFSGIARLGFAGGTLVLTGIPIVKLDAWFGKLFRVTDARIGAARCDAIRYTQEVTELQRRKIPFINDVAD